MSSPSTAFLGYGFIINKYEDAPMPNHLGEDWEPNPKWEKWADDFCDSEFCWPIYSYDDDARFFGIKLTDSIDPGEYVEFGNDLPHFDKECIPEWNNFMTEFEKFFPNSNKKPQYVFINIYWC